MAAFSDREQVAVSPLPGSFEDPLALCSSEVDSLRRRRRQQEAEIQELESERLQILHAIGRIHGKMKKHEEVLSRRVEQLEAIDQAVEEVNGSLAQLSSTALTLKQREHLAWTARAVVDVEPRVSESE